MTTAACQAGGRDVSGFIDNPAVLPPSTEQFSLALDFRRAAVEGMSFDGIALPAELENAVPLRRTQYLAGRFCAIEALRRLDPRRLWTSVGRSLGGAPLWPSGAVGSITHTEGFVSAAVASTENARSLGIDSEGVITPERATTLSRYVAWPAELAHAREVGFDRSQAITLVFSAKETIFKCLYPLVGQMFYHHDVRIVGIDAQRGTFCARLVKTLSPAFPADTLVEGRFAVSESLVHTGMWLDAV